MIQAACEGRGNGKKDAEGLARAGSGEGCGRWGGWTGRREEWGGWMVTGRGRQGGRIWKGEMGRGRWGGEQQEREEGGNGEGGNEEEGGRWEGGNKEGGKGKEVRTGMERRRGKRRGDFKDGYDGMPGWT